MEVAHIWHVEVSYSFSDFPVLALEALSFKEFFFEISSNNKNDQILIDMNIFEKFKF